MTRPYRFKSVETRDAHRRALDCPLKTALRAKAIAKSWADPAVRAKRIAGLRAAAQDPARRAAHRAQNAARPRGADGRFLPEGGA